MTPTVVIGGYEIRRECHFITPRLFVAKCLSLPGKPWLCFMPYSAAYSDQPSAHRTKVDACEGRPSYRACLTDRSQS